MLGLVLIFIIASVAAGGGGDDDAADDPGTTQQQEDATSGEDSGESETPEEEPAEEPVEEPEEPSPYAEQYGTFKKVTENGSGQSIVKLPKGASAGLVTASYNGSGNFSLSVLDANNQPTGDLLVNTIASYSGTTAWG